MEIFGIKLLEKEVPPENGAVSYVFRGATVECDKGSKPSLLEMPCSHGVYRNGKPTMNIQDCKPMVNIMPFGKCSKLKGPCAPATVEWVGGKKDVLIEGHPALLDNSHTNCNVGGKIKITKDGQD